MWTKYSRPLKAIVQYPHLSEDTKTLIRIFLSEIEMKFWLAITSTCLALVLTYLNYAYRYWSRKGVKQLPTHLIWGHVKDLKSLHYQQILQKVYDKFKAQTKVAGIYVYTKPVAVILDLETIKNVLIKDFNKFTSRMAYKNNKDILSQHLFNLEGSKWRPLRTKFSPIFTSGKMKYMFALTKAVAEEFSETYERSLESSHLIDIYNLNSRYTIDVIGSCILGFDCNSLKNPQAEFRQISTKIFGRKNFNIKWHLFKQTYVNFMKFFGHKRYPKLLEDFFRRLVREGLFEREKHNILRRDFVDLILELRRSGDMNLTYDQIAAQFFIFFAAGFETSSTTMTCLLYELARHPEIQEKLRQEIHEVLENYDNQITYEALMDMKYLDQVINETLRLYPPLPFLQRMTTDTAKIGDLTLPQGSEIFIPVWAIHHDPEIYPKPFEFQPERFNPHAIMQRHPQAFLGFGDGPRNCIGLRFGRMQTKIGLVSILSKYKFSQAPETCRELEFSNHSVVLISSKVLLLKVDRLEN
ncbi:putative cytochrome P450 6a14 [Haematobia irritans]|uniref:putative cytochrome P450 6a14 n=1 Tax=Haematobia irritans TaxID=7368 RepID=UPI003F50822C